MTLRGAKENNVCTLCIETLGVATVPTVPVIPELSGIVTVLWGSGKSTFWISLHNIMLFKIHTSITPFQIQLDAK